MYEDTNRVFAQHIKECHLALYVSPDVGEWMFQGVADSSLGRQMNHMGEIKSSKDLIQEIAITHISLGHQNT